MKEMLWLLCICLCISTAVAKSAVKDPIAHLSGIINSGIHAIKLTDRNYTDYLTAVPRDYHAVVMFTALADKFGCRICHDFLDQFKKVGSYYNQQYSLSLMPKENRIVFFYLDFDSSNDIFSEMKLESVPKLYILPPKTEKDKKEKMNKYEVSTGVLMEGAKGFIKEIENKTNVKINVTVEAGPVMFVLGLFAIIFGILVDAASKDVNKALLWYQSKWIYILISLACFSAGVSGSIYCLLRNVPIVGQNRQGGVSIFAGQGREQYTLEGIIVALWTIGCGASLYFMHYFTTKRYSIVRHLGVIFCMSSFIVLLSLLIAQYLEKTKWYQISEVVDKTIYTSVTNYMKQTVKPSSGLFKRLVRISEYVLKEYKDYDSFAKKFKVIIVDYFLEHVGLKQKK